jgi:hypothetical protein
MPRGILGCEVFSRFVSVRFDCHVDSLDRRGGHVVLRDVDYVQVALVDIGIAALDFFTIVAMMTGGGPNRASDVVAHYRERF